MDLDLNQVENIWSSQNARTKYSVRLTCVKKLTKENDIYGLWKKVTIDAKWLLAMARLYWPWFSECTRTSTILWQTWYYNCIEISGYNAHSLVSEVLPSNVGKQIFLQNRRKRERAMSYHSAIFGYYWPCYTDWTAGTG